MERRNEIRPRHDATRSRAPGLTHTPAAELARLLAAGDEPTWEMVQSTFRDKLVNGARSVLRKRLPTAPHRWLDQEAETIANEAFSEAAIDLARRRGFRSTTPRRLGGYLWTRMQMRCDRFFDQRRRFDSRRRLNHLGESLEAALLRSEGVAHERAYIPKGDPDADDVRQSAEPLADLLELAFRRLPPGERRLLGQAIRRVREGPLGIRLLALLNGMTRRQYKARLGRAVTLLLVRVRHVAAILGDSARERIRNIVAQLKERLRL